MTNSVKVLIADKMDPKAGAIFRDRGIEVDEKPGLSPDEFAQGLKGDFTLRWLMAIAPRYAGMLVPQRLRNGAGRAASRAA